MLTQDDRYRSASPEERPHLLAEVAMRAFAGANAKGDRKNWMDDFDPEKHLPVERLAFSATGFPDSRATTSYAIVDRKGLAVACSHTMNRPFGTAAIVPGTGIFFAAPPENGHDVSLAPVLVMRDVGVQRRNGASEQRGDSGSPGAWRRRRAAPRSATRCFTSVAVSPSATSHGGVQEGPAGPPSAGRRRPQQRAYLTGLYRRGFMVSPC